MVVFQGFILSFSFPRVDLLKGRRRVRLCNDLESPLHGTCKAGHLVLSLSQFAHDKQPRGHGSGAGFRETEEMQIRSGRG